MINRQSMRGTGAKTSRNTLAHTKPTKGVGARASVKAKGVRSGTETKAGANVGTRNGTRTETRTGTKNGTKVGIGAGPATGTGTAGVWRGEEVSSPSRLVASSAEDAASRAEGNSPVQADVAARNRDPGTYLEKGPARRPRANDPDAAENTEEKRQSAAEEHAGRASRHFPYGKL